MAQPLNDEVLDQIFRNARTHTAWLDRPVSDDVLHQLYDLMELGPTSANTVPARFVFLRTPQAKERLRPALSPGNVDKTMAAPVTAIVAYDTKFYEYLPKLFPQRPGMKGSFANNPAGVEVGAFRNGSLQGGYFIVAARLLGLDCGPMSGFDNAKVDQEFFASAGAGPMSSWKSNFLCNLGYGDASKLMPRNPRLDFEEACKVI
jgi:3-hydroxypropanoate dehydrogenase